MEQKILIIIPAYNEEKIIAEVYLNICNYNNEFGTNYDLIVINYGSTDDTKQIR